MKAHRTPSKNRTKAATNHAQLLSAINVRPIRRSRHSHPKAAPATSASQHKARKQYPPVAGATARVPHASTAASFPGGHLPGVRVTNQGAGFQPPRCPGPTSPARRTPGRPPPASSQSARSSIESQQPSTKPERPSRIHRHHCPRHRAQRRTAAPGPSPTPASRGAKSSAALA